MYFVCIVLNIPNTADVLHILQKKFFVYVVLEAYKMRTIVKLEILNFYLTNQCRHANDK